MSLWFSILHDLTTLKAENASFTYTWYCERDSNCNDCRTDTLEQLCPSSMPLSTGHWDLVLWGKRRTQLSSSNGRRAEELRTLSLNIPHWKNHPQTQNIDGSTLIRPTQTLSLESHKCVENRTFCSKWFKLHLPTFLWASCHECWSFWNVVYVPGVYLSL